MKQNGEPTVEEILASIKQVIARDSRVSFDPPQREPLASTPPPPTATPPAPTAEHDDVLDLTETVPADSADGDADTATPLLTECTRAAMRESLAALAAISGPGAVPQIVRSGETSLEGLTRELLRPALIQWLDKNLPALVERMVAAEIARIVGKKG
jgi:cell pole-organizing protein PopZ